MTGHGRRGEDRKRPWRWRRQKFLKERLWVAGGHALIRKVKERLWVVSRQAFNRKVKVCALRCGGKYREQLLREGRELALGA